MVRVVPTFVTGMFRLVMKLNYLVNHQIRVLIVTGDELKGYLLSWIRLRIAAQSSKSFEN